MKHNPAVDLIPFGHWTLRDEAMQRPVISDVGRQRAARFLSPVDQLLNFAHS